MGVDLDVDHDGYSIALEHAANEILGRSAFCRFGKGVKKLLLYWIDEPIRKRRTSKYGGYQVEILSRGSQFVAHGIHPDTNEPYEWVDANPLEHDIDALPTVTESQIDEFLDTCEQYLERTGLEKSSQGGVVEGSGSTDWCLQPDDTFDITKPELGPMTVRAIKAEISGATWECNLTAIRPDSDSGAGRISMTEHGLRVTDFVDMVTYFEAVDLSQDDAEALADVLPEPPEGNMFGEDARTTLEKLLTSHAYVMADDTVRRLDEPLLGIKAANFSKGHRMYVRVPSHPNPILVTNAWLEHPHAMKCKYMALRPDKPDDEVFVEAGSKYLNAYRRPVHEPGDGASLHFAHFMQHLVPDKGERNLVLDWVAYKLQHPEARMHALCMVAADTFGTGRGTFAEILALLIGRDYMTETTLGHLTGATTQSQYNDYLSQSLIVYVAEARDSSLDTAKATWYTRRKAYEAVKSVVETGARRMLIVRKGVANVSQDVYASLLISTNHKDALAIEDDDRRLLVVSNGQPLDVEGREAIRRWMRNPANLAAAYGELMLRSVTYDPFGIPPMTSAKAVMQEASRSGIDEAWAMWVERAAGDVCTVTQWRTFARAVQAQYDLDYPDAQNLDRILDMQLSRHGWRIDPNNSRAQIRVKGASVRPWVFRNPERWVGHHDQEEIRAEILLNGDPGGGVFSLPPRNS